MLKQEFAGNPLDRGRSRGLWRNRAEDIIEANVRRNGGKKKREKEGERRRSLAGAKYGACYVSRDDQDR